MVLGEVGAPWGSVVRCSCPLEPYAPAGPPKLQMLSGRAISALCIYLSHSLSLSISLSLIHLNSFSSSCPVPGTGVSVVSGQLSSFHMGLGPVSTSVPSTGLSWGA